MFSLLAVEDYWLGTYGSNILMIVKVSAGQLRERCGINYLYYYSLLGAVKIIAGSR